MTGPRFETVARGHGWKLASALLAVTGLLTGCATGAAPEPAPGPSPDTGAEPGGGHVIADSYLCGGTRVHARAIHTPKRIADLDEAGRAAVAEATYDDGSPLELDAPEEWIVVSQNETQLTLMRPSGPRELLNEDRRYEIWTEHDYEMIGLTTELWPGWAVGSAGHCTMTVDLGELGVPYIWLDPDNPPAADSNELHLLVLDPQCGGSIDMPERVEVVRLDESEFEARVLLGVRPLPGGAYTCEGFPPTPLTLTLDAPLGERVIVDESRITYRELAL